MTDFHQDGSDAPTDDMAGRPEVVSSTGERRGSTAGGRRLPYDQLDHGSAQLMRAIPEHGTATPEELATRTGQPLRTVLRRLPLLELADLVHRRDGGVALTHDESHVDTALADLVSAYCAANPDQPLKPYEIARGITAALAGRHVGTNAVLTCCQHLATIGRLVQVTAEPIAFAFPNASTPVDDDDNPRS
ncbi:helix-turn-helix transcriptional regulator [Actinoplanes auranticolor]|uniref:Uncharacterized protein n=1 Tax=Actinoplanes auranticolor TaxID=47988 RepID=A0A919VQ50_9ACTN|nr:helix-turn-helix transcriptional regulator [Actinoplanes auranticolor]GIM72131.1 hypothetical protein Aau02nite_49360 [Actinoplanes auranticolor]